MFSRLLAAIKGMPVHSVRFRPDWDIRAEVQHMNIRIPHILATTATCVAGHDLRFAINLDMITPEAIIVRMLMEVPQRPRPPALVYLPHMARRPRQQDLCI